MKRVAAVALVVVALAAGCSKKKKPAVTEQRPAPITVEERTRAVEACKTYAEKICACATAHPDKPDVAELCKTDVALPGALDLVLATMDNEASTRNDVLLAKSQVQKISASCFEHLARLPTLGCE